MRRALRTLRASSISARFLRGVLAQGYSQAITVALQLTTVPVLLHAWGERRYAAWLALSALPVYLGLADLGFAQTAANDMTMKVAAGDRRGALATFQSAVLLVGGIIVAVVVLAGLAIAVLPINAWLGLTQAAKTTKLVLLLLSCQVAASLYFGILAAALRAEGRFARAVAIAASARLLEGTSVLVVAIGGGGMLAATAASLFCRVGVTVYGVLQIRQVAPWLTFWGDAGSLRQATGMLGASLSFMGFNVGSMLSIQGTTVVLSSTLGPTAVVMVATARTLSRLGPTAANMIHYALQPEYSTYFGASAMRKLRQLFRRHYATIGMLTTAYVGLGLARGAPVIDAWTGGRVHVPAELLTLMIAGCALEMIWMTLQTPLVSLNRHKFAGTSALVINAVALGALPLGITYAGVSAVGWMYVAVGGVMVGVCGGVLRLLRRDLARLSATH